MLKKLKNVFKAIVEALTVAFFFVSLILFSVNLLIGDEINLVFSIINNFAYSGTIGEDVEVEFDSIEKKLINYPAYGTVYATIKIDDIGLSASIVSGDELSLISDNIGHYVGSYFPGEGGTVLLAAHNSKKHFKYLPNVEVGTEVVIETDYGVFTYTVYEEKIVSASDKSAFPIQRDKEILIMYTCYPIGTVGYKTKRYVVYAELTDVVYKGDNDES